jgi:SAM-dependent methyltransferase
MTWKSDRQRSHYDTILSEYDQHYFDAESNMYRSRFFYDPLFYGLDLNGKRVVDLACGSGYNSLAVLERFRVAEIRGIDISTQACSNYERIVKHPAHCIDLTAPQAVLPRPVDTAIIIGGLHHCIADLPATMRNLAQLITPGGQLLMAEPNADFFLNQLRLLWYSNDRYFDAETERPLRHCELTALVKDYFEVIDITYMGGLGYFLILNSLLFRLPRTVKSAIAKPLISFDAFYNRLPGKTSFPYFVARWRRTGVLGNSSLL